MEPTDEARSTTMMWAGWGWQWLWMVAFWAIMIGLVVWAVGRVAPANRHSASRARQILDERYARGEIDDDDYRRVRAALER
ncbi:SHOCT domain-containing protein [Euzebya sp.]|uniref:SHOCT domain-containing protein n=1 Tax=Euzebya sp. TaxID=1971409 RepID=UPI0035594731